MLFFRTLQLEGVSPETETITGIALRHTDAKWAADTGDLPPASRAEPQPRETPEEVVDRIAEFPTRDLNRPLQ